MFSERKHMFPHRVLMFSDRKHKFLSQKHKMYKHEDTIMSGSGKKKSDEKKTFMKYGELGRNNQSQPYGE